MNVKRSSLPVRSEVNPEVSRVQVTFPSDSIFRTALRRKILGFRSPRWIHLGNCAVFHVYDLRKQEIDSCYPFYNFIS